jgi:hypothetical protein
VLLLVVWLASLWLASLPNKQPIALAHNLLQQLATAKQPIRFIKKKNKKKEKYLTNNLASRGHLKFYICLDN